MANLHTGRLGGRWVGWSAVAGLLLLSGCRQKEGYAYGELEMLREVDQINQEGVRGFGYFLRFDVKEARASAKSDTVPFPLDAPDEICMHRTFAKEAEMDICPSESKLLLEGTMSVLDDEEGTVVQELDVVGAMYVWDKYLVDISLVFSFEGGTVFISYGSFDGPSGYWPDVTFDPALEELGWGGAPGWDEAYSWGGAYSEP